MVNNSGVRCRHRTSNSDYHQGLWWNNNCISQGNFSLPASFATPNIYFFNPGDTGWQSYLFSKESDAFTAYAFDGWQMDQLGTVVGNPTYTCAGALVDPPITFSGFITAAKAALNKTIVFNAPGRCSQQNVAGNSNLSFLYTGAWPSNGQTSYNDLRNVITQNSTWSSGTRNTVIAAYPDQDYSALFTTPAPGFLNTAGVLYEDASIFASGGSHIEPGDVDHMLDQPNYLNENLLMQTPLQKAMVNYYNFLTAYENLLRDGVGDNSNVINLPGGPATSTNGSARTVWTFARSKTGTDVLHLVNMLNLTSSDWIDTNANKVAPTVQTNVVTKYYYGTGTPTSASLASPDISGGAAQPLSFTTGSDAGGAYVQFTVPTLNYWDKVWVNK